MRTPPRQPAAATRSEDGPGGLDGVGVGDGGRRLPLGGRRVACILIVLVAALLLQAMVSAHFLDGNRSEALALALARLVTLPLLVGLVLAVLGSERAFLLRRFAPSGLTARIVVAGIAAGLLMRVAAWAQITARGAFGWIESARSAAETPFQLEFACPAAPALLAVMLSWTLVVPLSEELVHRGVLQSCFASLGKWGSVAASTVLFTLMHEPAAYLWVALMGTLLAVQYWNSRHLWLPLITHATYDGLIPLDTLCLNLAWNPRAEDLPLWGTGVLAALTFGACVSGAFWLARESLHDPPR